MDKIKVSEIRAKFPMYGDLSDDDLIIGIRQKFYPDIPIQQFVNRIDYDTQRARQGKEITDEMNGVRQFAAGMGKGMTDVARGIGQMTPFVSRSDVRESRELDAPLMRTGAGVAGNIAGTVIPMLPTAMIPGANTMAGSAAIGAGLGLLSPSESTRETLKNIGMGGVLAPLAIGVGRGLAAGVEGARALTAPFTRRGQERIAADVLQSAATNPQRAIQNMRGANVLVPGSAPTMGQVASDPGIAQLERTLAQTPDTAAPLQAAYEAQRAARAKALSDIAGTDEYYNAIREGRKLFAEQDYGKAMAAGIDQDMARALKPQIDSLLRRPSMQEAQQIAKRIAKEKDVTLTDMGSIEGLDWIKKSIDRQINSIKSGTPIGKTDLETLLQTKDDLMQTIEQIAPAYKQANDAFAGMSRQVNSMDVARDLQRRLLGTQTQFGDIGTEGAEAYKRALMDAAESVKKQTGMNRPLSDVMLPNDVAMLENIGKDLARKQAAQNLGRGPGSPTMQNLASQAMIRRTLGPTGLPQSWAENTLLQTLLRPVDFAARVGTQRVTGLLADAATNPQEAARLLAMQQALPLTSNIMPNMLRYGPALSVGVQQQ